ncbi:MAG: leucyl aminopeptidase family protein [Deltaproteobacteria bacterium]
MSLTFATDTSDAIALQLISSDAFEDWLSTQPSFVQGCLTSARFSGALGSSAVVPDTETGKPAFAVGGSGTAKTRQRGRFHLAKIRSGLPSGIYKLAEQGTANLTEADLLGWLLEGYRFARYKPAGESDVQLVAPSGFDIARIERLASGEALTRDLINTPPNDLGPDALEAAAKGVAESFGAQITTISGDALARDFPMIHAVGHGSSRRPRLVDITWGESGPTLTLVGKGVCFDTGGLDIKPAAGMGLMKKDMGGAATVLGLATMIMGLNLPLRLRVLLPIVENSISGDAMRPQDILKSRKGLSVEVNNTDAEGRLILADALAYADEAKPDLLISMATLTGAARVAVGPDLAPFFASDDALAQSLSAAGDQTADPLWRLPFWEPYESMIEPGIADLDNAPAGGFAGAITAALFLRRFVTDTPRYAHFDIYGWQPTAAPGRPKGGVGQGARAILNALPALLDLK